MNVKPYKPNWGDLDKRASGDGRECEWHAYADWQDREIAALEAERDKLRAALEGCIPFVDCMAAGYSVNQSWTDRARAAVAQSRAALAPKEGT